MRVSVRVCVGSGGNSCRMMMVVGVRPVVWLVGGRVDGLLAVILGQVVVIHCLDGFVLGVGVLYVLSEDYNKMRKIVFFYFKINFKTLCIGRTFKTL